MRAFFSTLEAATSSIDQSFGSRIRNFDRTFHMEEHVNNGYCLEDTIRLTRRTLAREFTFNKKTISAREIDVLIEADYLADYDDRDAGIYDAYLYADDANERDEAREADKANRPRTPYHTTHKTGRGRKPRNKKHRKPGLRDALQMMWRREAAESERARDAIARAFAEEIAREEHDARLAEEAYQLLQEMRFYEESLERNISDEIDDDVNDIFQTVIFWQSSGDGAAASRIHARQADPYDVDDWSFVPPDPADRDEAIDAAFKTTRKKHFVRRYWYMFVEEFGGKSRVIDEEPMSRRAYRRKKLFGRYAEPSIKTKGRKPRQSYRPVVINDPPLRPAAI